MYGLVNEAIRDLVITDHGEETWARIAALAGTHAYPFVTMCPYSDAITYAILDATAEVLGTTRDAVLERFGEHWFVFSESHGYRALLEMCGRSFPEFLEQLETIHGRMKLAFPALAPPVISCVQLEPDLVRVDYSSGRGGLSAMVIGLLRGLARRFAVEIEIEQLGARVIGGGEQFLVRFKGDAS